MIESFCYPLNRTIQSSEHSFSSQLMVGIRRLKSWLELVVITLLLSMVPLIAMAHAIMHFFAKTLCEIAAVHYLRSMHQEIFPKFETQ